MESAQAPSLKSRVKRWCITLFILVHLYIMTFWGMPPSLFRGYMTYGVQDYVIKSGLWHSWDMFSPDPLSVIFNVYAEVHFEDRTMKIWEFPRMEKLSILEKFRKERYRKWRERVRQDTFTIVWDDTARYVARLHHNPTNPPRQIVLVREWDSIPAPRFKPGTFEMKSFQRMPKEYDDLKFNYRFKFYTILPGDL